MTCSASRCLGLWGSMSKSPIRLGFSMLVVFLGLCVVGLVVVGAVAGPVVWVGAVVGAGAGAVVAWLAISIAGFPG